jgi:hypothetical protein
MHHVEQLLHFIYIANTQDNLSYTTSNQRTYLQPDSGSLIVAGNLHFLYHRVHKGRQRWKMEENMLWMQ